MRSFMTLLALIAVLCFTAGPASATAPPGLDKTLVSTYIGAGSADYAFAATGQTFEALTQPRLDVGIALLDPTDRTTLQAYYGTAVPSKGASAGFTRLPFLLKT